MDPEVLNNEHSQEIHEKIRQFDEKLAKEHEENITNLAEKLDNDRTNAMLEMRADMAVLVGNLDKAYNEKHEELARGIFNQLISE